MEALYYGDKMKIVMKIYFFKWDVTNPSNQDTQLTHDTWPLVLFDVLVKITT